MAQTFDTDQIASMKRANEMLRDVFSGVVPAFQAALDMAHEHNIAALERECNSGLEGAQAIVKQAEELGESLDKLIKYYEEMENALA